MIGAVLLVAGLSCVSPAPAGTPAPAPILVWAADGSWLVVGRCWWSDGKSVAALPRALRGGRVIALSDGSMLWLQDDLSWLRWRPGQPLRKGEPPVSVPPHADGLIVTALEESRVHVWLLEDRAETCKFLDLEDATLTNAPCYPHGLPRVTGTQRALDGRMAVTSSSAGAVLETIRFNPPHAAEKWDIPELDLPPSLGARLTFETGGTVAAVIDAGCDGPAENGEPRVCVRRLEGGAWKKVTEQACDRAAWSSTGRLACWQDEQLCVTAAGEPDKCAPVNASL